MHRWIDTRGYRSARKALFILSAVLFGAVLMPGAATTARAQDYAFTVPQNYSDVYINTDGSVTIRYQLTFYCEPGAHAIDIVDIGLPNENYVISTARAWTDTGEITSIYPSEYIDIGVEVHLGSAAIYPGQTGTLYFEIQNDKMVWYDDDQPDTHASVEFSPTWYGSAFTSGVTDLSVSIHFPEGVGPDETIYHYREFDNWYYDDQGRIAFNWRDTEAKPSKQYMFGVSFPLEYVGVVYEPYHEPILVAFLKVIGSFVAAVFFLIVNPFTLFLFFMIGLPIISVIQSKRRKLKYFPPSAAVEGVGIKRGLTAPEAAMVLEQPLNKVITMMLFGLMKKGYVRTEGNGTPKIFEIKNIEKPDLRDYEKEFLACLKEDGTLDTAKLKKAMIAMIKATNKKIKGFSRRETKDYYANIVDLAWRHVTSAKTPELLGEEWSDKLEWILMDKKYGERMEETFTGRDIIIPRWYDTYWGSHSSTPRSAASRAGGSGLPKVSGADLANNFITGVESFSGKLVSNVETFVSSVTETTNPAPKSSGGGYRGGGGGGCACACACAGCACACAGGGR
ncbi:MAG: hypothetical protein JW885_04685 [Deltaproteobacteria bacterium]|nr:hypothetical protein [Candidatus Zymogenaceae bacterium]